MLLPPDARGGFLLLGETSSGYTSCRRRSLLWIWFFSITALTLNGWPPVTPPSPALNPAFTPREPAERVHLPATQRTFGSQLEFGVTLQDHGSTTEPVIAAVRTAAAAAVSLE